MDLLPQRTIDRLARARFPVRRCMRGSRSGSHRSPFTGASAEFAQHRQYSPGDEPRRIDWRVLARTDRFVVKQYDQETNLRATVVVDTSASMGYAGSGTEAGSSARSASKLAHAAQVAAGLAWVLIRQGDAVGLVAYDQQVRLSLPVASTVGHLQRLYEALSELRAESPSATADVLHQLAERIPSRGLILLFGDFLEEPAELLHALHHLRHRNHELVVCQVLAPEEIHFPFSEAMRFRDVEGISDLCDADPAAIRGEYCRQIQLHLAEVNRVCREVEADYLLTTTDEAVDKVLIDYLAMRQGKHAHRGGGR